MSIYTVHEPPLRAAETMPDPDRFAFVRDGFSVWAFLFAVLWMLWHRLWLVLLAYVVVVVGIETALRYAGFSGPVLAIVAVFISLLVGIEFEHVAALCAGAARLEKCRRGQRQRS